MPKPLRNYSHRLSPNTSWNSTVLEALPTFLVSSQTRMPPMIPSRLNCLLALTTRNESRWTTCTPPTAWTSLCPTSRAFATWLLILWVQNTCASPLKHLLVGSSTAYNIRSSHCLPRATRLSHDVGFTP